MLDDLETGPERDAAAAAAIALDNWLAIARPIETITARIETTLSERHSICLSAYEVMAHLAGKRGWTHLSEVCRAIARSQPRISRLVAQMQHEGLVDRDRVDGDGRAVQLNLTRKGRRVYFAASETLVSTLEQVSRENTSIARLLDSRNAFPAPERG